MLHLSPGCTAVVIGWPGSGKTHTGNLIARVSGLHLCSTDSLLHLGPERALDSAMDFAARGGCVVEGMIAYRLLRKREQRCMPPPFIVVQLDSPLPSDPRMRAFCKAHETILADYFRIRRHQPSVWLRGQTHRLSRLLAT